MRTLAVVLALLISVVGVALFARAAARIVGVIKLGQPTLGRSDHPGDRWKNLLIETFGHTRMRQWSKVGIAHWAVFIGFLYLFFTLVAAYGQLFRPDFSLPIIGHFFLYEWGTEVLSWLTLLAIVYLMITRFFLVGNGKGRFFGSHSGQAIYVELTILAIGVLELVMRALDFALLAQLHPQYATTFHFPLTSFLAPQGLSVATLETAIVLVAALKIVISMAWFCTLGLILTMGVAWHRFTAWPNIWFKRESDGATALGAMQPINVDGKPVGGLEDVEELSDEQQERLGVGRIEDFAWKGLLDFTSCTECGRCQSQCPAWNTEKPLSPKLLMMGLREHAYAKAPWLQAAESARGDLPEAVRQEAERPLVGVGADALAQAEGDPIRIDANGAVGVVDPDVLWSCTSCGACVQQCPVDIEHVDHIMDMRRFEVLVKSEFPEELNGLYKGLESKGNPWNLNKKGRLDWTRDLPFSVPVVGTDVEDLSGVEYLFWVGCAGAFEDRAKKTTQAVAELLNTAGVSFAVLGTGETCTGDPARRSGNEFVFQQLAAENVATLTEAKAHKVITTCAHCLNTLKNEYPQVGVELEVVHHTQLLNRLVRDGRLTPVAAPSGEVAGRSITYHDPCYLGRHNQIYEAPRDLLGAIPGAMYAEMPRHGATSFCCGAGGARMWMEEKIGTRINRNRTSEALTVLGQDENSAIATACPFCRVMISDGLTAEQQEGRGENVEVLDVAQLLLESVRRGQPENPAVEATVADEIVAPAPEPVIEAEPVVEPEPVAEAEPTAAAEPVEAKLSPIERAKLKAKGGTSAPAEAEPTAAAEPVEAKLSPIERAKLKAKGGTSAPAKPAPELTQDTTPAAPAETPVDKPLSPIERAKLKAKGGTTAPAKPAPMPEPESAPEPAAPAETPADKPLSPIERAKLKAKGGTSATARPAPAPTQQPEPAPESPADKPAEQPVEKPAEEPAKIAGDKPLSPIERAKLKAGKAKATPTKPAAPVESVEQAEPAATAKTAKAEPLAETAKEEAATTAEQPTKSEADAPSPAPQQAAEPSATSQPESPIARAKRLAAERRAKG